MTRRLTVVLAALLAFATAPSAQTRAESARTWIGRTAEIEAYLRTAPIARTERADRGVTQPVRAFFEPGGPIESMTWKALPAGRSRGGYYESYQSEIASYELDKLLDLNMVPPKVERELEGTTGVAVMWVTGARSFASLGGVPKAPANLAAQWNTELIRAKMFHNLVGDIDPNLGNWLVDGTWHVILIDQSRAVTTTTRLIHTMQGVDRPLWQRMRALTEEELTRDLGQWLDRGQIRALLERRDRMQQEFDRARRN